MPLWIQTLQGMLTPIIAGTVAVIAYFQWRTASDKVALDLFDRRYSILEQVDHGIFKWLSDDERSSTIEAMEMVERAALRSEFLFGPEVATYAAHIHERMAEANKVDRKLRRTDLSVSEKDTLSGSNYEIHGQLIDDRIRFTELCRPYMRHDRRIVRTPWQWFRDRDALRRSYGDDAQGGAPASSSAAKRPPRLTV